MSLGKKLQETSEAYADLHIAAFTQKVTSKIEDDAIWAPFYVDYATRVEKALMFDTYARGKLHDWASANGLSLIFRDKDGLIEVNYA